MKTPPATPPTQLKHWIAEHAEPFDAIGLADLGPLMDRIGDARVVLIGEASHGTSQFYRMRQNITAELIRKKDFRRIGIEGDWPDVERVDEYVRGRDPKPDRARDAFRRFPSWMWRNQEVLDFVDWLQAYNEDLDDRSAQVGLHGLDLYSLYTSIHEVMDYLERSGDRDLMALARNRYGSLLAYEPEAQAYGRAVQFGMERKQEDEVVAMLNDLLLKRLEAASVDQERVFDAEQNSRVVANAEAYYRSMFRRGCESWNLRDSHMFETLQALLELGGDRSEKIVVWAHNSHLGDARATEMSLRGELNLGQLVREHYGDAAYAIGLGTHTGTVAAVDDWGDEVKLKAVNESEPGSHEYQCHRSGIPRFLLPLRSAREKDVTFGEALERAIGVIYRPDSELVSHYFEARLEAQFDEYIWFDFTDAVQPLSRESAPDLPERHPFQQID